MKKILGLIAGLILAGSVAYFAVSKFSADEVQTSDPYPPRVHSPEEELVGFELPEGFIVELVASERDGIVNPIDLTFDDAGRLWTQTARMYPLDPFADMEWQKLLKLMDDQETQRKDPAFRRVLDLFQGKAKGTDQVLVLSDFYDHGRTAKVTVWADSLAIPMSIMPFRNGAYVAQGSELFFLDDTNGDDKADRRIPLITGFGFTDTHTMAHSLVRGPGNWIYFSHGALNKGEVTSLTSGARLPMNYSKIVRFSMDDAAELELVACGLNNIWGFQLRDNGQWYATEANDLGYATVPLEAGAGFPGIGNERLREYQPFMPEIHKFRVGGTGLSGLAFADDIAGSFPGEWRDVAFLANPITSTINAVRVKRNPDGTVTTEHLPDLLTSRDKYFRPVNIEFGPDGCLYIADWYNKIISHNEVPTSHPDRDRTHGRLWRIRHVDQKPREITNFHQVATNDLAGYLKSPSLWERRAAWHQIADRAPDDTRQLIPALVALAADTSGTESARIHALWCLEALRHYDPDLLARLVQSPEHDLRREAVRSLATFRPDPAATAEMLRGTIDDSNPMVRSQSLRTLRDLRAADASTVALLVDACKPELPGNEMGGSYERRFERYLALMALEQYPDELYRFINRSTNADPRKLLWAIRALPRAQMASLFPSLWTASGLTEFDEPNFITVSKMLDYPAVVRLAKPIVENPRAAANYLRLAIVNQRNVQSENLSVLLERPASTLLRNGTAEEKDLALDAIGRLKIKVPTGEVAKLISDTATDHTVALVLKVLDNDMGMNGATYARLAQDENIGIALRVAAAHSLARTDRTTATRIVTTLVPSFDQEQKLLLTSAFSSSEHGALLLTDLYDKGLLDAGAFSDATAERVQLAAGDHSSGGKILNAVRERREEEQRQFQVRLTKYMDIAERKDGDAGKGEELFKTCLMCHRVGSNGQDIAPALDGSASRESEALLTALLDPDVAVEKNYALFRVIRKDNTTVEGYLIGRDGNGTTIAFMGGNKVFIPAADLKSQGFLGGRSFMPRGLIDGYTDRQVADLLAYVATLK